MSRFGLLMPAQVALAGKLLALLTASSRGMAAREHPTMTDGYPYAFAQVIIDAAPEATP